jgi:hypothetical protein
MTPMFDAERRRLARPVRLMYWLLLIAGLALFTTTRRGDSAVTAALWVGAIAGTLLGQHFALHNYRLWISALAIAAISLYCAPLVWIGHASAQLWLSFIPAALCGFWSLGDRSALAALWFPTVLWMLTILDRSDRIAADGSAAILLGGLAGLFICFLSLRESRRVALWRSVAAEPLAPALPTELLREPPGRQLARAGWWLTVGALTVAITVWLVPPLWQSETLGGPPVATATATAIATGTGRPCCPVHGDADTVSSRVKEYLDLGLGHDTVTAAPREGINCRRCSTPAPSIPAPGAVVADRHGDIIAWSGRSSPPSTGIVVDMSGERRTDAAPVYRAVSPGRRHGHSSVHVAPGARDSLVPDPSGRFDASAPAPVVSTGPSAPDPWARDPTPATGDAASSATAPSRVTSVSTPDRAGVPSGEPLWSTPRHPTTDPAPAAPMTGHAAEPSVASASSSHPWPARPQAEPLAPASPAIPDQRLASAGEPPRPPSPTPPPPRSAAPPAAAPRAPTASPSAVPPPPPPAGTTGRPTAQSRAATRIADPSLLSWLAFAVVAAVVSQIVRLGLRPLRRLVTVRHLRRPFWDETIAQRISNAWQLALVGLRDAGWRTGPSEPPRDLARRAGVDGLDRCATILERARHGVGLDAGDLAEMQTSADTAYRAARTGVGGLPRLLAWLRWPLT